MCMGGVPHRQEEGGLAASSHLTNMPYILCGGTCNPQMYIMSPPPTGGIYGEEAPWRGGGGGWEGGGGQHSGGPALHALAG